MANSEHEQRLRDAVQAQVPAADFSGCDLSGLLCSSIRIVQACLRGADLRRADLSGGYLRGCDLRDANCSKATISTSDLREANLAGADLTGADLRGATLTSANLAGANLRRAKLVKARVDGADFTGANLKGADLRGVQGLTAEQFRTANNGDRAILDERTLASLGLGGNREIARHGKPAPKRAAPADPPCVDLLFTAAKPSFGDVYLLCGSEHPGFPPTGDYGFAELVDLGVEQVDDYFAVCVEGEPAVWIQPLVRGEVVEHHPGPYDGLRLEADAKSHKNRWAKCVERFEAGLKIPLRRELPQ